GGRGRRSGWGAAFTWPPASSTTAVSGRSLRRAASAKMPAMSLSASSRLIARIVSFALLLEHFVELLLDRRGVLLERIVVDGEQVQLLERDLALRRRQVGARRIGAVSYHDS